MVELHCDIPGLYPACNTCPVRHEHMYRILQSRMPPGVQRLGWDRITTYCVRTERGIVMKQAFRMRVGLPSGIALMVPGGDEHWRTVACPAYNTNA